MARRSFDVVIAGAVLLLLAPVLLAIGLAILLDDRGPVLFVQTRVGSGRRPFRIYKFRTMRDGVVTRAGAFLRAAGLDELPQLVNVLAGDMSLLGPRPLTPEDVRRLGWDDAAHDLRWRLRPGIAGLAQLYAGRGARLSWFLDCRYVRARGVRLDLFVLLATAAVTLVGKRRVRALLRQLHRRAGRRSIARRALPRRGSPAPRFSFVDSARAP